MKKKILAIALSIGTGIILGIPVMLNNQWISEKVSWYFSGLKTPDYKMTYISLLGGIIGVWLTVGTTLLIQMIFESNEEKEKVKIINNVVREYLLEEIQKNHKALTSTESGMHTQIAKEKTVLDLVNMNELAEIKFFQREFVVANWTKYAKILMDTDIETFMMISKLYDCYIAILNFNVADASKLSKLEKSGIYNYERKYKKFEKRFADLIEENSNVD